MVRKLKKGGTNMHDEARKVRSFYFTNDMQRKENEKICENLQYTIY